MPGIFFGSILQKSKAAIIAGSIEKVRCPFLKDTKIFHHFQMP
jgi:hypothetical protein